MQIVKNSNINFGDTDSSEGPKLRGYITISKSILRMKNLTIFIFLIGLVTSSIIVASVESIDIGTIKMTERFPEEYKPHIIFLYPYDNSTELKTGFQNDWDYAIVEIGYLYTYKVPLIPVLIVPLEGWNLTGTNGVPPLTISVPEELASIINQTIFKTFILSSIAPLSYSPPGLTNLANWITTIGQTYYGGITQRAGLQPIVITTPLGLKIIEKIGESSGITYKPLYTAVIFDLDTKILVKTLLEKRDAYELEKAAFEILKSFYQGKTLIDVYSSIERYNNLRTEANVLSGFTSGFFIMPVIIANGTILYIAARLLVFSYRRWIALFSSRGISLNKILTYLFITILLLSLAGSVIGTLGPIFILRVTHQIQLSYKLDPYTLLLVPLTVSFVISGFSTYRLHRVLMKKTKLEMVMQVEKIIEEEEWKPNAFIKTLFIISLLSAVMTLAGISIIDVFNYASKTESSLLTLFLTFTGMITALVAPFSPLIITYYIIMSVSSSVKLQTRLLKIMEPLIGREKSTLVKSITTREMPTISKITFIIAFIISVVTAISLMKYNVTSWINSIINAKLVLGGIELSLGIITSLIGLGEAIKHSLYWIAPVGIIVIALGIATVTLFSSMYSSKLERESIIFRARGADRKAVASFMYSALFPPLFMSIITGLAIGYVWAKTFASYFSLIIETITLGQTSMPLTLLFPPQVILILSGIIGLMILIPVFSITKVSHRPVAERLRGV